RAGGRGRPGSARAGRPARAGRGRWKPTIQRIDPARVQGRAVEMPPAPRPGEARAYLRRFLRRAFFWSLSLRLPLLRVADEPIGRVPPPSIPPRASAPAARPIPGRAGA